MLHSTFKRVHCQWRRAACYISRAVAIKVCFEMPNALGKENRGLALSSCDKFSNAKRLLKSSIQIFDLCSIQIFFTF